MKNFIVLQNNNLNDNVNIFQKQATFNTDVTLISIISN